MSQPAGLFSVRRPRETLGPIQNYSGIPAPASAMKRTSSSQNMRDAPYTGSHMRQISLQGMSRPAQPNFHRSSSGGNLAADMGMSGARRSTMNMNMMGTATAHRQSLAPNQLFGSQTPASASVQRRSSIYSRPSGGGGNMQGVPGFFANSMSAPVKRTDPRVGPQYGKAARERMGQELFEYLTQNNFELEMKHQLRPAATSSPTQNDFNLMFQWLYKRIDPNYKFQKSIEVELPQLMKQLRYPYGTDIPKSHIYPITPNHWPKFLLMFHWMMQLAQMLENFTRGAYDDACMEAGVDVNGERIVFRFLFGAYQDWLQVSPDQDDEAADAALEPHRQAMSEEFSRINEGHIKELEAYEAENAALRAQIEEIEKSAPDVAKLDKHFKILEDDKKKFEDYNSNVQAKIEKYEARMKILQDEITKTESDLFQVENERSELQQAVDNQGISTADIDRMNTERERLTKSHDDALSTLETVTKQVSDKEVETIKRLEDLELITKRYNTLCYQISLIPSTAVNANNENYELVLNLSEPTNFSSSTSRGHRSRSPQQSESDRLLAGPQTGYSPISLLNLDLRGHTRASLINLRKEVTKRRHKAASDASSDRALIETVSEVLSEKSADIQTLTYRLASAQETHATLVEEFQTAKMQMLSNRERMEKDLARMRDVLDRGGLELEQREMEAQLAYEALCEEVARRREEVQLGVERILEEVIRFKLHVKEGLEGMEKWVGDEVEGELEGVWEGEEEAEQGYVEEESERRQSYDDDDDVFD